MPRTIVGLVCLTLAAHGLLSPDCGRAQNKVDVGAYLDDSGRLRHSLVLRDAQTGFAGESGHLLTIDPDGSWRHQTFLNANIRDADRSGKFAKQHLPALARQLAEQNLLGLPERIGKPPAVNPHTYSLQFGDKRVTLILTGGAPLPKSDPANRAAPEQRFAFLANLLMRAAQPEKTPAKPAKPLQLTMNDSDETRAQLGAAPGKPPGQAEPIPLVVGQAFDVKFLAAYANGRAAYRLDAFGREHFEQQGKPTERVFTEGPYKGNTQRNVRLVARRPGTAELEFGFGATRQTTVFTLQIYEPEALEKIVQQKGQGVRGLVFARTGNQQPRIGIGGGKAQPISVPVHVFRGRLQPFAKPNPKHGALVKIVKSDKQGRLVVNAPPGVYTLVPEIDGKLQTQRGEVDPETGRNYWPSVRVYPGQHTPYTMVDTSRAVF